MEITYLCQNFSDRAILYSPELNLPETPVAARQGYPAVSCSRQNPQETYYYFYILPSQLKEYEEYRDYYWTEFLYEILGGRETIERKFLSMVAITEICTIPEAAKLWEISEPMIEKACRQGRFSETEARKSGDTWLISLEGMRRIFAP